jgi:hypothetical protein
MLYDGLKILEGGKITNPVVDSGLSFPANPDIGELFFRTSDQVLYVYTSSGWSSVGDGEGGGGTAEQIYDLALTVESKPDANEIVFFFAAPRSFGFPVNFTGSVAKSAVASTGTAIFTVSKNGTQFGTITFTESSNGVFSSAALTYFNAGDVLSIVAPMSQDSTLDNIGITLVADTSLVASD